MNRCVISFGILTLLIVLSVSSLFILYHRSDRFTEQVEAVKQTIISDETERTLAVYDELMEEWEHFRDVAGVFVDGTKLDPIRKLLVGLRPLIEAEHSEVLSELERIRGLAEDVFTEEIPDFWHIL